MDKFWKLNRSSTLTKSWRWFVWLVVIGTVLVGCASREEVMPSQDERAVSEAPAEAVSVSPTTMEIEADQATEAPQELIPFSISSPAFVEGDPIPITFSCDGENQSPALEWGGTPEGTFSFVLVMDDPDAPGGTWVHWVLFNIPAETTKLPASIPTKAVLDDGAVHGANSWGRSDYGGPCPPGGTHRYYFKLYALDSILDLSAGADLGTIDQLLRQHLLGETSLMGTYTR